VGSPSRETCPMGQIHRILLMSLLLAVPWQRFALCSFLCTAAAIRRASVVLARRAPFMTTLAFGPFVMASLALILPIAAPLRPDGPRVRRIWAELLAG